MPKAPKAKHGRSRKNAVRPSTAHLDKLIEEATVDCYNESEEVTGIFTMLEENLAVPFSTTLLEVEVTVERVDQTLPVRSWRSVGAVAKGCGFPSSTYRCRSLNRKGRNGSMLTGDGLDGDEDGV